MINHNSLLSGGQISIIVGKSTARDLSPIVEVLDWNKKDKWWEQKPVSVEKQLPCWSQLVTLGYDPVVVFNIKDVF